MMKTDKPLELSGSNRNRIFPVSFDRKKSDMGSLKQRLTFSNVSRILSKKNSLYLVRFRTRESRVQTLRAKEERLEIKVKTVR